MVISCATRAYDLFYIGHLSLFKNAKTLCDKLIVGVAVYKGKHAMIPFSSIYKSFLLVVTSLLLFILPLDLLAASNYKLVEGNKSLTSQIQEANTVYEIKDVFDLKGAELSLPKNVGLRFIGGMFRNGLIEGEGVYIESHLKCFDNISFS